MEIDSLVHMANRIAEFFDAMPDRAEGLEGIANHLHKFWEPRMRTALLAHAQAGGAGLHPMLAEALRLHGAALA